MTPPQFRDWLQALATGPTGFAKALAINPRTVRRWCSGDSPVPTALSGLEPTLTRRDIRRLRELRRTPAP